MTNRVYIVQCLCPKRHCFTRWSSMEEASPHLEHAAMDQLITRVLIELHKAKASAN